MSKSPPNDSSAVQIHDHGQVQPAFVGGDVGQIAELVAQIALRLHNVLIIKLPDACDVLRLTIWDCAKFDSNSKCGALTKNVSFLGHRSGYQRAPCWQKRTSETSNCTTRLLLQQH